MAPQQPYGKVSQSPTLPGPRPPKRQMDVADLYRDPASAEDSNSAALGLAEKLRKAYFWITNFAIINPFYDVEYQEGPSPEYSLGDSAHRLVLPSGPSYSSFVLLPLLNLVVRRRCLLVGGPGRGKTASAILMGLLAGYSSRELKRSIQHGQPQMTVTDLLGNPIPSDLLKAESMENIRIAWRKWLSMRVKIIDEYNRIPTRTQSALLTVMADNYAEILDQIYECPEAAWYLTANDDAGGGTYQVIDALKDRIDVVVRALHFNTRFVGELLSRIERGVRPENAIPRDIIFSEAEIDSMHQEILALPLPDGLRRRLEYFASQFEFLEPAGSQLEYQTKDNLKLSGLSLDSLGAAEGGKDRSQDLGLTTTSGLSVRALMTSLVFVKALAWFRGAAEVTLEDLRNMLPFVLHDKLSPNPDAPFFEQPKNKVYRVDRIGWIRRLFDLSCAEYEQRGLDDKDPVGALLSTFQRGLDGLTKKQVQAELSKIERELQALSREKKIHGPLLDDLLSLKYLHQRYANYLRWLSWQG